VSGVSQNFVHISWWETVRICQCEKKIRAIGVGPAIEPASNEEVIFIERWFFAAYEKVGS
jgi:hypothetical protein